MCAHLHTHVVIPRAEKRATRHTRLSQRPFSITGSAVSVDRTDAENLRLVRRILKRAVERPIVSDGRHEQRAGSTQLANLCAEVVIKSTTAKALSISQ